MNISTFHRRTLINRRSLVFPLIVLVCVISAITCAPGVQSAETPAVVGPDIKIDDEHIADKFYKAREFSLTKVCRDSFGNYYDCRREIGPPGQVNTLAGMEFPWKHPGGRINGGKTRKFVYPPDVKAKVGRIATLPRISSGGPIQRETWEWPAGTTLFELHYHPKGHPFELRMLTKTKEGRGFDCYEVAVIRPAQLPEDIPVKVKGVLSTPSVTSGHPYNAFKASNQVTAYEDVDFDWMKFVKSRKWADDTGHEWHHTGQGHGWLSPKSYAGWMTGSTKESCAKCHKNAGTHTSAFEPFRDWYGFVPGGDGIFSFDPINRKAVRINGVYMPQGVPIWSQN